MIETLKREEKYIEGMSNTEIENVFLEIEMMSQKGDLETSLGKLSGPWSGIDTDLHIIHQPPNGDCFYYSLAHGLNLQDMEPMENSESPEGLSKLKTFRNVSVGAEPNFQPVFTSGALRIRELLANKISENIYDNKTGLRYSDSEISDYFKTIAIPHMTENGSIDDYIVSVQSSASRSDVEKVDDIGSWGGEFEIILAPAVFNLNIIVLDGNNQSISRYLAVDHRKEWSRGPELNNDSEKTIYLGFLNGSHYTLMYNFPESEVRDQYEIIKYYIKTFTIDGEKYPAVFDSQDGMIRFHGLFDLRTYKINKQELIPKLIDESNNYIEINMGKKLHNIKELEHIDYFRNINNASIYSSDYTYLGMYVSDMDNDGQYYKIDFI